MANENRLIDANALMQKLSRMIDYCKNDNRVSGLTALFQVGDLIMDCPTVDAVEVVHGRWIKADRPIVLTMECSVCHMSFLLGSYNYCPNCGAKMDGEGKDNE